MAPLCGQAEGVTPSGQVSLEAETLSLEGRELFLAEGILGSISSLQPESSFLPTLEVPLVYLGHSGKASVQNSL